jgi:hypothetical protein
LPVAEVPADAERKADVIKSRWQPLDQVVCLSGGREDERPLKFRCGRRWIRVERILSEWLERGPCEEDATYRIFDVETERGGCKLRIAEKGWHWEFQPGPDYSG